MEFKFERGNKNFVDELMKSVPIRSVETQNMLIL